MKVSLNLPNSPTSLRRSASAPDFLSTTVKGLSDLPQEMLEKIFANPDFPDLTNIIAALGEHVTIRTAAEYVFQQKIEEMWNILERATYITLNREIVRISPSHIDSNLLEQAMDLCAAAQQAGIRMDISEENPYATTVFVMAAQYENINALNFFLENEANIDAVDDRGISPLFSALLYEKEEAARCIITAMKNPKKELSTELHVLVLAGYEETAISILQMAQDLRINIDINAKGADDSTLLEHAVQHTFREEIHVHGQPTRIVYRNKPLRLLIHFLLAQGAKVDKNIIAKAFEAGDTKIRDLLIENF